MEIRWNLWGMLPHSLPQEATASDSLTWVIIAGMKKVIVCSAGRLRAKRATEMRGLLRYARPHGGNTAERMKQARPRTTRD